MSDDPVKGPSHIDGKWTEVLNYAGFKKAKRRRAKHLIWLANTFGYDSEAFRNHLSPDSDDAEIIEILASVPDHLWPKE